MMMKLTVEHFGCPGILPSFLHVFSHSHFTEEKTLRHKKVTCPDLMAT